MEIEGPVIQLLLTQENGSFSKSGASYATKSLQSDAEANGIKASLKHKASWHPSGGSSGELWQFVIEASKIAVPALAGILGSWVTTRGRKISVKIGDISIEARSAAEVEKLLKRVQEIQQRNEPKKIHEP